jgi:hypothetical protein
MEALEALDRDGEGRLHARLLGCVPSAVLRAPCHSVPPIWLLWSLRSSRLALSSALEGWETQIPPVPIQNQKHPPSRPLFPPARPST